MMKAVLRTLNAMVKAKVINRYDLIQRWETFFRKNYAE